MRTASSLKEFLETLKEENVKFKRHFYEKAGERPISEGLIKKCLKRANRLLKTEKQISRRNEEKYKLWFKLSNKYILIIIAVISKKSLYIITAWNTNRKWQTQK